MGCLSHLLGFIFLLWVIRFVARYLIAPFLGRAAFGTHHPSSGGDGEARRRYLAVLMPLLAKLAKSDGRVSEQEIDRIERIFAELQLSPEDLRFAQETFIRAKDSPVSFTECAEAFAAVCGNIGARQLTLDFLIRVAKADGEVTQTELRLILTAARCFGFPDILTVQLLRQHGIGLRTQGNFGNNDSGYRSRQSSGDRPYSRSAPSREEDLALLGLGPNATKDEIKKAYRAKAKELHPDRLQSQGLPESMLKQASERLAAINAAYARLK